MTSSTQPPAKPSALYPRLRAGFGAQPAKAVTQAPRPRRRPPRAGKGPVRPPRPLAPAPPRPEAGRPPSPHAQVGAVGVVAAGREHPAGVGADVPGPGLRDPQGAAAVQADAGVALRAQRDAVFLPHVPERGKSCSGKRRRRGGVGAAGGGLSPGQVWSRELQRLAPGQGGAGGGLGARLGPGADPHRLSIQCSHLQFRSRSQPGCF